MSKLDDLLKEKRKWKESDKPVFDKNGITLLGTSYEDLNCNVDTIITDPPYLIGYKDWDKEDFEKFTNKWLELCSSKLKPGGTIWSFMAATNALQFIPLLQKYVEVDLRNWVVWCRQKGRSSTKHLKSQREDIFYGVKKGADRTWNELKMLREVVAPYMLNGKPRGWFINQRGQRVRWTGMGNVWVYTAPQYNSKLDRLIHPAQKPVMLLERLCLLSSNEGDLILDPFMGSGSTAVACIKTGRRFIGFETDREMYLKAVSRIEKELK